MGLPVRCKTITTVELYKWLPTPQRLDVWPFALLYSLLLLLALTLAVSSLTSPPLFTLPLSLLDISVATGIFAVLHILTLLFTAWSVDFRCFAHARKVSNVEDAEICKVVPTKFGGSKEVVPILRREITPAEHQLVPGTEALGTSKSDLPDGGGKPNGEASVAPLSAPQPPSSPGNAIEIRIEVRKQQLVYDPSLEDGVEGANGGRGKGAGGFTKGADGGSEGGRRTGGFKKLAFPNKGPFRSYSQLRGYGTEAKVQAARAKWGENKFVFPQPTFMALFKEQCMEPFFVFQVLCVGLWCLDEYWYYSLFTLFMLLMFETTVVTSRLRTLTELRRVRVDPQSLLVHRGGKWVRVPGPELVPGDVVSLGRPTSQVLSAPAAASTSSSAPAPPSEEEPTVPADMLLLAGTLIANEALLTGESTPQWKTPCNTRDPQERLSVRRDRAHVIFGGTKILQHTADKTAALKTPDGGCLAVVLRTGFDTSQGKLMRTILFSTDRVTANNLESGLFILFLVFFALIAAGYVLMKGLEDGNRSRYKLLLNCSLIITAVIPPELPMELSIAVNTSLVALIRKGIYCTEPFRIPFAGKVDVCCFDKTGTLTSDHMEFRGVVGADEGAEAAAGGGGMGVGSAGVTETQPLAGLVGDPSLLPLPTLMVLASCHALVVVDGKLVGDPLEKAAVKGVDWAVTSDERASSRSGPPHTAQIVHRYHFASHLKRMSVVVRLDDAPGFYVLAKGAPETIEERLERVPPGYTSAYRHHTRQGSRVLALGYKRLPDLPMSEVRSMERDTAESGLTFAGFAVFACPIREDSPAVLEDLKRSSHDLMMITGDQALTACHVAAQVHIMERPALILTPSTVGAPAPALGTDPLAKKEGALFHFDWLSPDELTRIPFSAEEVGELAQEYDLSVAGDGLSMLQRLDALQQVVPYIQVFARVSPEQKELILTTLKAVGRTTLMCGDGTNDVGALKQAHVGVALLNAMPPSKPKPTEAPESASKPRRPRSGSSGAEEQPRRSRGSSGASSGGRGGLAQQQREGGRERGRGGGGGGGGEEEDSVERILEDPRARHARRVREQQEKLKKMMKELQEEGAVPTVKLGDASMASPFTAKHASVSPTRDILRQGRATLVTTLQMFKILGLNCLASAYVLSVMSLDGVKLGDTQATIAGMLTAVFFLIISQAKPLETLSPERPHPNVFSPYVILSILGQFACHLTFLIFAVRGAQSYMPEICIEPDMPFHPNIVNTVSYMVNMMIQVATFAVNYVGHPFNQSIVENTPFLYSLGGSAIFFFTLTSDLFRELNDSLELVELPQPFGASLVFMAAAMFAGCYLWEALLRWCFPVKKGGPRKFAAKSAKVRSKTLLEKKFE